MLEVPSAEPAAPRSIDRSRRSLLLTTLCAVVIAFFVAWIGWLHRTESRLDGIAAPEEALALLVSRGLELGEALERASPWERWLQRAMTTDGADELAQGIAWYEELAERSLDPGVDLHLAILLGEAGDTARLRARIDEWERRQEPLVSLAAVVRGAYLEQTLPADERASPAAILDELPPTWFTDRLTIAWARRTGDSERLRVAETRLAERARSLLWRVRALAALEAMLVVLGLIVLIRYRRRREPGGLAVGSARLPPPWPVAPGILVLIRGGAAGIVVIVALFVGAGLVAPWVDLEHPLVEAVMWPLMYLPVLWLAYRHLLNPHGLRFREAFGLGIRPGGWRPLVSVVLVLVAVGAAGEWALSSASGALGVVSHWAEWFDEELVWGDAMTVVSSLLSAVVVAPIFEELVFRGLLYATLRRVLGPGLSAVSSAALFAVAHGYGAVGFVDVLWSGWLWAWSFERTGSVLPGMIAHGVTNLIVSVTILALLR